MSSSKTILHEIKSIKTQIELIEMQKEAIKDSLLSEGLIDALVDLILGPFIHLDAIKFRNTPEYKEAFKKIQDLKKQQEKLQAKAVKLQADYEKQYGDVLKKQKHIKSYKSTKAF